MTEALCGFRPSGRLHLGHYYSVILPGKEDNVTVLVANYHAPETLESPTDQVEVLRAFGVQNIVHQTTTFDAVRYFRLMALAKLGDVRRTTRSEEETAHALTYPVLMAHDIMGYCRVIVGHDQIPHVEFARRLISAYNKAHGTDFPLPVAHLSDGRVRDLKHPEHKMSKSMPGGCLFLDDSPADIERKIMKARTCPLGVENLKQLLNTFVGGQPYYETFHELKQLLVTAVIEALEPARCVSADIPF